MAIRIVCELENCIIHMDTVPVEPEDEKFIELFIADKLNGKTFKNLITLAQATAILALGFGMVGEDKTPGYWIDQLYVTAREALVDCSSDCSPIP